MPYKDGAPTLGEQLEADEARKFYTDEILAEAQDLMRDNKRLRAEVERLKGVFWRNPKNFEQVPCGICGYNGPNYYQPSTHPCAVEYHRRRNENQTPK